MTSPHEDWKSLACSLNASVAAKAASAPTAPPRRPGDKSNLILRVDICQWGDKDCDGKSVYPDPPPVPNVYACNSKLKQLCCNGAFVCPPTNVCRCGKLPPRPPPGPPGPTPGPAGSKYTCTGTPLMQCVVDANGKFPSAAACNASCITHFTCTGSPATYCTQAENGRFTSMAACNASCTANPHPGPPPPPPSPSPPPAGKYTCTGTPLKKCIPDSNGLFSSFGECSAKCINRFTCTGSPKTHCVQAANGNFTSEAECQASGCGRTGDALTGIQCDPDAHPLQTCPGERVEHHPEPHNECDCCQRKQV